MMTKAFAIDFIRQIIIQTIQKEYAKNPTEFIGSENDFRITSFYEHLLSNEEIDRYVETVRDLNDQQNRTGLIANGTIVSPENPTITNIFQALIIPLTFTLNIRSTLANRDMVLCTLHNMVSKLKGRKHDIAEFDNGKLFLVGTLGHSSTGIPTIKNGDFIGTFASNTLNATLAIKLFELLNSGFVMEKQSLENGDYFYFEDSVTHKLCVAVYNASSASWVTNVDDQTYPNIIFPPEHNSFKKYSVSLSFDSMRCSEPRTLNNDDYCDISFGGSATIVSNGVKLGNSMVCLSFERALISGGENSITLNDTKHYLEPLELGSNNNANNVLSQQFNTFIPYNHNDSVAGTLQYTFIVDDNKPLIKAWFDYARYCKIATTFTSDSPDFVLGISPNMIYVIEEIWVTWGVVDIKSIYGKLYGDISIENNESDTLTLTATFNVLQSLE